jgi:pantothenate synthetase
MQPVRQVEGDVLAVIAARVGSVRLIDNAPVSRATTNGRP